MSGAFAVALSVVCAWAVLAGPAAASSHPLETAIADVRALNDPNGMGTAFARVRGTGASAVRLYVSWSAIAPDSRPAEFDPANPADPAYKFAWLDQQVLAAHRNNLEPILSILDAPDWAEGPDAPPGPAPVPGTQTPDAGEFARFARAAALRYSGRFGDLPRVRYWQAWNEPNLNRFLWPQFDTPNEEAVEPQDRLLSPDIYRRLVNAFAKAVHEVNRDNLVVAGGLGPFGNGRPYLHVASPLAFMRELLCMNERDRPKPGCNQQIRFDAWAVHPYTSGGPNHSAISPLDVSLGDLDEVRRLLARAIRAGRIVSKRRPLFWVTEFSWDTKPPDPGGVPTKLHRRWVAHALYRMWQNGISLVTWFQIQDSAPRSDGTYGYESGLRYYCDGGIACAKPKPSLQVFRFPFVAFRSGAKVRVWGRTPFGLPGQVAIEQRRSGGWRRVALLRANRHGIFMNKLRARRRGVMRARLLASGEHTSAGVRRREASVPFSLKRVPDRSFNPFGNYDPPKCPSCTQRNRETHADGTG